jgi:hypothetical protein
MFDQLPSVINLNLNKDVYYYCDEAQLPNVNTATGSQTGLYTGLGNIDYPHTKVYTDLQLGFMLDTNLTMLKEMNKWHSYIFPESGSQEDRVTRVRFRNQYAGTIYITKSENGPDGVDTRQPITYVIEKAYPYAIDAVPLQFGSSQITKVTVQFKYQRHRTIDRDVRNVKNRITTKSAESMNKPTVTGGPTAADQERAAAAPRNPTNQEIGFTNGDPNKFIVDADNASSPEAPLLMPDGSPVPPSMR